jgi:hypothetical protein
MIFYVFSLIFIKQRRKNMKLYHKIETIFNRDETGSKKLIEGSWRNETVEFLADNIWLFTEKIDGTNIRVMWDGHNITFGGRTESSSIPAHLMNKLIEMFANEATEQLFEQIFGEKEVIFFGEGYGPKIQSVGSQYRDDVSFILFDVMVNDMFLKREDVEGIASCFDVDVVPVIFFGTLKNAVEYVKTKPMSTIGTAPMEGLVGRPQVEIKDRRGERVIVKIKVKDFC